MIETNNFAFQVKVILGLESTCPDDQGAKIGLNGPKYKQSKGMEIFQGLLIETSDFAFEVKVILGLESTRPDGLWLKQC